MFPIVGLLEETKRGEKEDNDRVNNTETLHICVGTKYNNIH
jgi:hypothetical protein